MASIISRGLAAGAGAIARDALKFCLTFDLPIDLQAIVCHHERRGEPVDADCRHPFPRSQPSRPEPNRAPGPLGYRRGSSHPPPPFVGRFCRTLPDFCGMVPRLAAKAPHASAPGERTPRLYHLGGRRGFRRLLHHAGPEFCGTLAHGRVLTRHLGDGRYARHSGPAMASPAPDLLGGGDLGGPGDRDLAFAVPVDLP
ncbi:hypothetical protein D3C87_1416010 [compost metagenome]